MSPPFSLSCSPARPSVFGIISVVNLVASGTFLTGKLLFLNRILFMNVLFSGVPFMHFDVVSEAFAHGTMIKMPPKTCDLDAIPSTLRFDCTDNVLPALTIVINLSLSSGTIPKSPKNAILKPLLNKASLDQKKFFFFFFFFWGGEL